MTDFFRSRWIEPLSHVAEGGEGLPAGFRAAGAAAQIKASGAPDVGLMVCDAPEATSAARFTASGAQAPPAPISAGCTRTHTPARRSSR